MQNKKDESTFWSTGDDSDDDFETIINSNKKDSLLDKDPKDSSVLSSEKMDFLWSDDEEENGFSIGNKNEVKSIVETQIASGVPIDKDVQEIQVENNEPSLIQNEVNEELKIEDDKKDSILIKSGDLENYKSESNSIKFEESKNHKEESNLKKSEESEYNKEEPSLSLSISEGSNEEDINSESNRFPNEVNEKFENIKEAHEPQEYNIKDHNIINKDSENNKELTMGDNDIEKFDISDDNDTEADNFFDMNKESIEENEIIKKINALSVSVTKNNFKQSTESLDYEKASDIEENKGDKCSLFDNSNEDDDSEALKLFNIKEKTDISSDLEIGIKNLCIDDNDINKEPLQNLEVPEARHTTEVNVETPPVQNLDFLLDENDDDQEFFFDNINTEEEVSIDNKDVNGLFGNPQNTADLVPETNDEIYFENLQQIEDVEEIYDNHEEVDELLDYNIDHHEEDNDFVNENNEADQNNNNLENQDNNSLTDQDNIVIENQDNNSLTDQSNIILENQVYDEQEVNLSQETEPVENIILPKGPIDLFEEKPITCFLNNGIFTYYRTKQKRYSQNGESKDHDVNIFNFYKLGNPYELKNLDVTNLNDNKAFSHIYKVLSLRDIHGDSVSKVIGARDVIYTLKSQVETHTSADINSAFNISNVNTKMAVDYCISKKMWAMALILSNNDKDVVSKVLSEMLDDNMKNLILDEKFVMEKPWIEYFMHFINSRYSDNHDKYIKEVYKSNIIDGYFVIISFHLCKIVDIKNYLHYFSHNPRLLEILIYINQKLLRIEDIDLLLYEHILDIKDRNILYAKEFYKIHKKDFKKDLQTKLDEIFNLNWNFGIKDVLSFGINKILDVQENEPTKSSNPSEKSSIRRNVLPKKNISYKPKNQVQTKFNTKEIPKSEEIVAEVRKEIITKNKDEVTTKVKEEVVVEKNIQTKEVYTEQKHSKSFADFFENDKEEKEVTTEDDTSLFLSKYNIEDDDEVGIKKPPAIKTEDENNSSFFNIFGLFKKKSYKVDLQATDDIKYDPVTKKWVTGGSPDLSKQSNVSKKSIPVPKAQISPLLRSNMSTPDLSNNKPEAKKGPVDLKKMSMYAGKKKSNVGGFSTLKKDNNQN